MDNAINLVYLAASVLFILGIRGLTHPRTAVRGNLMGATGMLLAVAATLPRPADLRHRPPGVRGHPRGGSPRRGDRSHPRPPHRDDRDARDGGAAQRLRRRRLGPGRGFGARERGRSVGADDGRDRGLRPDRLGHVLGQPRRVRQAAGAAAARRAGGLPGAAGPQRRHRAGGARARRDGRRRPGHGRLLRGPRGRRVGARRPAHDLHRRRRHARRHRPAQLLLGARSRLHRGSSSATTSSSSPARSSAPPASS